MDDTKLKFKFIYNRFLVIFFSFLAIYSFLHWLLSIKLHIIDIDEMVWVWAFPILLPVVPLSIWLRKRIRLLNLEMKEANLFANYLLVACLAVTATTVAFQYYLISATGELKALKNPEDIALYKPVKYYTVEKYYADKPHARLRRSEYTSGRSNRTLNYEIVIAIPLYARSMIADTVNSPVIEAGTSGKEMPDPAVWACLLYKTNSGDRTISWENFQKECEQDFKNKSLYDFVYLDRPGNSHVRELFEKTVKGSNYEDRSVPQVFEPRYEPFAERSYGNLGWTILLFIVGAGGWLLMISRKYFDEDALDRFVDQRNRHQNTIH